MRRHLAAFEQALAIQKAGGCPSYVLTGNQPSPEIVLVAERVLAVCRRDLKLKRVKIVWFRIQDVRKAKRAVRENPLQQQLTRHEFSPLCGVMLGGKVVKAYPNVILLNADTSARAIVRIVAHEVRHVWQNHHGWTHHFAELDAKEYAEKYRGADFVASAVVVWRPVDTKVAR